MKNEKGGFYLKAIDGEKIYVYVWNNVTEVKGVVQIFHGMAEHALRYKGFAAALNAAGYIVYADDHRGHGKSITSMDDYGHIEKNGFNMIVKDEYQITKCIKRKYPEVPVYILGHSFGSFIAQEYIIRFSKEINGAVIVGSACNDGLDIKVGRLLAGLEMRLRGKRHKSTLLTEISFKGSNDRIDQPKVRNAWLTRDEKIVEEYDADEYCGGVFSSSFYYAFAKGMERLYIKERLNGISKNLKLFIISGEMDPVGGYGKKVKKLYNTYKAIGLHNIKMKLYEEGRHEILNELNREEVYNDIIKWLDN